MSQLGIQATRDWGKVHLALDGAYIDSIDSYNCWLMKIVASLLGWSMNVNVGGKVCTLDKKEYADWVNRHTSVTGVTKDTVHEFADLSLLHIRAPEGTITPMRAHLSTAKAKALYKKLVKSMCKNNDFEAAKKYVGKGADLDRLFWECCPFPLSLESNRAILPNDRLKVNLHNYSPLLYAAEKQQTELCQLMRRLGANAELKGKRVEFERDILHVFDESNMPPDYTIEWPFGTNAFHIRPTIHTSVIIKFQDKETKSHELVFNPADNSLVREAVPNPETITTTYDRVLYNRSYRLV